MEAKADDQISFGSPALRFLRADEDTYIGSNRLGQRFGAGDRAQWTFRAGAEDSIGPSWTSVPELAGKVGQAQACPTDENGARTFQSDFPVRSIV